MSFLQPLLLARLPLVALPIIIHLINQRRYQTIRWAAMMFLLAANRMSRGYARLRQWLIMAFRMAAIAGLDFRGGPAAGRRLARAGRRRPGRHDDHHPRPLAQHAAGGPAAACRSWRPGGGSWPTTLETLGSSRWVLIDSATNKPRELRVARRLADLAGTGPAGASADLPAMLAGRARLHQGQPGGPHRNLDLLRHPRERLERRQRPLAGAPRRFLEFAQGVRFHLLAYPQTGAGQPRGAGDRRPPAEDRGRRRAAGLARLYARRGSGRQSDRSP